jgi:predicted nuclease of restriction endonuclease-like (RecB) superfamily
MEKTAIQLSGISDLVKAIQDTNKFFLEKVQRQVNTSLTLRNWVIGHYIAEYEQHGKDRAEYGQTLYAKIAEKLKAVQLGSIRERHLYICKNFYLTYPHIINSSSANPYLIGFQDPIILRTLSANSPTPDRPNPPDPPDPPSPPDTPDSPNSSGLPDAPDPSELRRTDPNLLLTRLSFSHFIELLNTDSPLKRSFYEIQAIKNNWSVRELKRAIGSMQYERTGLSKDKNLVMQEAMETPGVQPENFLRNPYLLEFLGLEEKPVYTESDLEAAIIAHLQSFLLEMGRGFCFEARQKRITFDNTHYHIDLVFYHRILRCHVLIDLKIGEFSHADAGQMNVYLNYFKENESQKGDNPPIGIILCAGKQESLVKYATMGLSQKVFVSKYLINLPRETEFQKIMEEQREKLTA